MYDTLDGTYELDYIEGIYAGGMDGFAVLVRCDGFDVFVILRQEPFPEEVAEGVGAIPEFMLLPEAVGDGEEEKFVEVRGLKAYEAGRSAGEADPAAGKKSERVQAMPSSVSFRHAAASCSSSGQPHSGPVMTGW